MSTYYKIPERRLNSYMMKVPIPRAYFRRKQARLSLKEHRLGKFFEKHQTANFINPSYFADNYMVLLLTYDINRQNYKHLELFISTVSISIIIKCQY